MSERQTIFNRFAQLPPLLRLAGYAAIAIILFLFWSDYIAPTTREWTRRADAIQADVKTVRDSARIRSEVNRLRDAILAFGPVDVPRTAAQATAVHAIINEVLAKHGIPNDSLTLATRGAVQARELATITPGRVQPDLLSIELRFESSPDVAAAVIADIESRPEIEAISLLHMNRLGGSRRVSVRLNIEAWVLPSGTAAAAPTGRSA